MIHSELRQFHELYVGSSFPTLITTETGEQLILKMKGCGNGPRSLLGEFIVNRTAHLLGWPVPDAQFVWIRDDHPWEFGTDEFDDILTRSAGWNLGITFIPGAEVLAHADYGSLATDLLSQIFTLDLFFANIDRGSSSRNLLRDSSGFDWIIDHGSLLLFNSVEAVRSERLHDRHFLGERADLSFRRELLDSEMLLSIVSEVPTVFLDELGVSHDDIRSIIRQRIEFLKSMGSL